MFFPETTDLGRAINEFVEVNSSLNMPNDRRDFEGHLLAQVIAQKIEALPPNERQDWIVYLLGYLAAATNMAYKKGVEVEKMLIPSVN